MVGEHIDSVGSLNPEMRNEQVDLCKRVEKLISCRMKLAQLQRDLSDATREEAQALKEVELYWLERKIKSFEGE